MELSPCKFKEVREPVYGKGHLPGGKRTSTAEEKGKERGRKKGGKEGRKEETEGGSGSTLNARTVR